MTIQYSSAGYYVCSHMGCSKKVDDSITDHPCCGRCSAGRDHRQEAAANYAGPGGFFHTYWETVLNPGACATCGETADAH